MEKSYQIRIRTLQLTWLGAAGFKVDTHEGAVILIDPFFSRPPEATPPLPLQITDLFPVDEILLTNGRFDHALDTPALVKQTGAIVHAPEPVCQRLAEKGVPTNCLQSTTLNKTKRVGSVTWQALAGQVSQADSSPTLRALIRDQMNLAQISNLSRQWPLGEIVAYFFLADGLSIIHFGSAGWIDSEIDGLPVDIALLPVESPPDTDTNVTQLAVKLKPKVVIPHHWDNYYPPLSETIDLSKFEAAMQRQTPPIKVYRPSIGKRFELAHLLPGS
jgi:L-ascorbate metabolism protein UlaG (beta-lactamase superfamily)